MNNTTMKLYSEVKFQKGETKTLLVNIDTRESFFLSNEILNYIIQASDENIKCDDFISSFADEDDRAYIKDVVDKLIQKHMLEDSIPKLDHKRISISLDITNRCNLACIHCCVSANDCDFQDEMTTEEMKGVIAKIAAFNPHSVSISGGEPLVRKDFKELISYFRSLYDGDMDIITNGTLIDEEMAEFFSKNFQKVSVSLDGCDENSCSIIRGKGTFDKAIKGIQLLKEYGVSNIFATMTICKENEHLRNEFKRLCEDDLHIDHGFRKLDVSERLVNLGYPIHQVDPEPIMTDEYFTEYKQRYLAKNLHKIQPETFSCQGARREFQIDYRGYLFPCAACMEDEFLMWDMRTVEDFTEFFESGIYRTSDGYKKFMSYMPYNIDECKGCNKNLVCHTCVRFLIDTLKDGTFHSKCKNYSRIYDLIWEE